MAFESLSAKLQATIKRLKGQTRVTEKDVKEFMREIRMALLEADVNYKVVKDFIARVSEKAVGQEVLESLSPGQQIVKIVDDELTGLLGADDYKLDLSKTPPNVILLVGLQGTGKTTACAKLAAHLRKQGRKPLMAACDIYRPAAVQQLQVLGRQIDIPVYTEEPGAKAADIAKNAVKSALRSLNDVVIVDTAGRLQIDEALMDELDEIKSAVNPAEILLVIDAMTGQEAANVAAVFNERLAVTGIILSKLDSDTRGGAALSVRAITGKPVKFASAGEKINDFEIFYPKRMADRILGMGDVLTLIDKAVELYDEKKAEELEKKLATQTFTLDDFLDQLQQIKKMGGIGGLLKLLPGAAQIKEEEIDEKQFVRIEAIIQSMTKREKRNPDLLNASRRKRIAAGSGTTVQDVNRLMKQFEEMRAMMKRFGGKGKKGIGRKMFGGKMPDIFL
ncbi:MAG: signal recognition particle protein [Clostridiales bacterium]|nr:signal recognition particle protein [Clostridiales bacterium]PWM22609.1 MAG: signal recognition particle protein [Clostridiales bacterium]